MENDYSIAIEIIKSSSEEHLHLLFYHFKTPFLKAEIIFSFVSSCFSVNGIMPFPLYLYNKD